MTRIRSYMLKLPSLQLEIHVIQLIEIRSEGCNKRCDEESCLFHHVANCSVNISEHGGIIQKLIFLHMN